MLEVLLGNSLLDECLFQGKKCPIFLIEQDYPFSVDSRYQIFFNAGPIGRLEVEAMSSAETNTVGSEAMLFCNFDTGLPGDAIVTWYKVNGRNNKQKLAIFDSALEEVRFVFHFFTNFGLVIFSVLCSYKIGLRFCLNKCTDDCRLVSKSI